MSNPVEIGGFQVGPSHPPLFLAEIGALFNQDLAAAIDLTSRISAARDAAPETPLVLKGEILHDVEICLNDETEETYVDKAGVVRRERYRDLIERKVIPLAQYRELFAVATDAELPFVLSVYDFEGVDFAMEIGATALKIASANLSHLPLIRRVAATGAPMLIDTGRAHFEDVARAVRCAQEAGCRKLVVEHSPDGHPAAPEMHNLRILETYARAFDVPVGLSCHFQGEEMLGVAVALGASLVEKGVTLEPGALDQDVAHAMALENLPDAMRRVNQSWVALGQPFRPSDQVVLGNIATSQRPGLVAREDLSSESVLTLGPVGFAWPQKGVPVKHWDLVEGWILTRPVRKGEPIAWTDVRPPSS